MHALRGSFDEGAGCFAVGDDGGPVFVEFPGRGAVDYVDEAVAVCIVGGVVVREVQAGSGDAEVGVGHDGRRAASGCFLRSTLGLYLFYGDALKMREAIRSDCR